MGKDIKEEMVQDEVAKEKQKKYEDLKSYVKRDKIYGIGDTGYGIMDNNG